MLRRSERIEKKGISISSFDKFKDLTHLYNNDIQNSSTNIQRIHNLNLIYNIIYNEFYDIRYDINKISTKKEDFFIHLIKVIKNKERVLLDELEQPDIKDIKTAKTLKRNIIKTSKKIRKYIETYHAEKKEAFIRLSSKIGIDLVKNIKSFL
jgi:hypothetical protein